MKRLWLLCALLAAAPAFAGRVATAGFVIEPPEGWELRKGFLGAALNARPARATDAEGWATDLLLVTSETYDPTRTCLDGFVLRKLKDMGHLANHFAVVSEQPLNLGKAPATLLELRYAEGPRELAGYMMVMASRGRMVTATLTSDPRRFEFRRASFRKVVESLLPARR